jgi:hypothetical protein
LQRGWKLNTWLVSSLVVSQPTSISHQSESKDRSKPMIAPNNREVCPGWEGAVQPIITWKRNKEGAAACKSTLGHLISWLVTAPLLDTFNCLILNFKLNYKSVHSSITMLYIKWIPKISRKQWIPKKSRKQWIPKKSRKQCKIIVLNTACSLYYNI